MHYVSSLLGKVTTVLWETPLTRCHVCSAAADCAFCLQFRRWCAGREFLNPSEDFPCRNCFQPWCLLPSSIFWLPVLNPPGQSVSPVTPVRCDRSKLNASSNAPPSKKKQNYSGHVLSNYRPHLQHFLSIYKTKQLPAQWLFTWP